MTSSDQGNLPDIVGAIRDEKERGRRIYPCHTNRASEIGSECIRQLVYARTEWQRKELPSVDLQFIFDGGKVIEPYAIGMLRDAGFQVFEQQRSIDIDGRGEKITGHLDMTVGFEGKSYPCEVKGLAGWTWDGLNKIEDFFASPRSYVRRYPAQLLCYMYGTNSEDGCFLLLSKQTWQPKVIWMHLSDHVQYLDQLFEKARTVNGHVEAGTLPGFTDQKDLCKGCDFLAICGPPLEGIGEIVVDLDLEDRIRRWYDLREFVSEYNGLDKSIKGSLKGRGDLLVGEYLVTGKWIERDGYEVKPSRYWQSKIVKL